MGSRALTGLDLEMHAPDKMLQRKPATKLSVAVLQNKQDTSVPYSQAERYLSLFRRNPDVYDLKEVWIEDFHCGDETHCQMVVLSPDVYRRKLCIFWNNVFGGDVLQCEPNDEV